MQNLLKRIDQLEQKFGINGTETSLQSMVRKQNCLTFFYSIPKPSQDEMVAFARKNSDNEMQYKNNQQIFQGLVGEQTKPRVVKNPTYTGRTYDTT